MKILAIVFIVAAFALLLGMISPVAAPGDHCDHPDCSACAGFCQYLSTMGQCLGCCDATNCPPTPSWAICVMGCGPPI